MITWPTLLGGLLSNSLWFFTWPPVFMCHHQCLQTTLWSFSLIGVAGAGTCMECKNRIAFFVCLKQQNKYLVEN